MGVLHGLLVIGAIGLVAMAPCLVCLLIISADEILERVWRAVRRVVRRVVRGKAQPPQRPVSQHPSGWRLMSQDLDFPDPARRHPGGPDSHPHGPESDRQERGGWFGWLRRRAPEEVVPDPVGPPIQQVAGDLRRLNRLRVGVATRSPVWFNAVQRAYDEGLRVACAQLGITQYLDELAGTDLAVERLRVEGELQRAGLALRDAGAQQR